MDSTHENVIDYPAEITFKAVFRSGETKESDLENILNTANIHCTITNRASKKGNFISYTVTGVFESDDSLQMVCNQISYLSGFMMMF